jgi:hypothetical protein
MRLELVDFRPRSVSAKLKRPGKQLRIWPEIIDVEPDVGLKPHQAKPKIPGTVSTNRHTTTPNDSGQASTRFNDHRRAAPKTKPAAAAPKEMEGLGAGGPSVKSGEKSGSAQGKGVAQPNSGQKECTVSTFS